MGKTSTYGDRNPAYDPAAHLSPDNPLIRLSAMLAVAVVVISCLVAGWVTYDACKKPLVKELLSGGVREVAEGTVTSMTETANGVSVSYEFSVGTEEFSGRSLLASEKAIESELETGSLVEVYFRGSAPKVNALALAASSAPTAASPEPDPRALVLGATVLLFAAWCIAMFLSGWEHLYLLIRYRLTTGGWAWIQVRRMLYNGAFLGLVYLLVLCATALYASVTLRLGGHFWMVYAGGALLTLLLMGLLLLRSPFAGVPAPQVNIEFD